MNAWAVIIVLALYIAILFACAFYGERYADRFSKRTKTVLFGLTLGVYCTSWTFYGAVGASVRDPLSFLPIYLGPLLFLWLGLNFWQRLVYIRNKFNINSIADFIAARYGKSSFLGALVALFALLSILPYLALQLHAIDMSASVLFDSATVFTASNTTHAVNTVLFLTIVLTFLAMLFTSRNMANNEKHQGLMLALSVESAVKLIALIIIGVYALFALPNRQTIDVFINKSHHLFTQQGWSDGFWTQTILAGFAMFCLPRQFHVSVIECADYKVLKHARRHFTLYLLLTVLAVIPISGWALANLSHFANPDMAVLLLPLAAHQNGLAILAFLGGFSAATGMLLVSTITLSIMLSNDLIVPLLWRIGFAKGDAPQLLPLLRSVRRLAIIIVMLCGYLVYRLFDQVSALSAFGLMAFAGVAQFAPALIAGLYWRGASKYGAVFGLCVGFFLWGYCLVLPIILNTINPTSIYYHSANQLLTQGLFGFSILRPEALFGVHLQNHLAHGVMWSLLGNTLAFIVMSRRYRPSIIEQIQAEPFLDQSMLVAQFVPKSNLITDLTLPEDPKHYKSLRLSIGDLAAICSRVLGHETMLKAFETFAYTHQKALILTEPANASWWQLSEQLLSGVVGAASARTLLSSALSDQDLGVAQIASLLDQTSQWQRFNQKLLMTMIDHLPQGVSVVDKQLKLVAWNKRYIDLFDYPAELIYVGCYIADLIRFNALRGECGDGSVEMHVHKRLKWLKAGKPHVFERIRKDGKVIEMRGQPIEGGGFVTTFADITAFRQTEALLEARVTERTAQLEIALKEQQLAREQADQANLSKSRFVAAASHDLLQPMHAARLFSASLEQSDLNVQDRQTLGQLERALHGAESILSALLDIARLDAGALQAKLEPVSLSELLEDLAAQYMPIAKQRGLTLHVLPTKLWVYSDAQWLRRIIQNLVSNALRYTARGRIVVGVLGQPITLPKQRSTDKVEALETNHYVTLPHIRLGVWDTGPGIQNQQINEVFKEFQCGASTSPWGEKGIGLGLAIVQRMVQRLQHQITVYTGKKSKHNPRVQSQSHAPATSLLTHKQQVVGCCFMLTLPKANALAVPVKLAEANLPLSGLCVLCVDDEQEILDGMQSLLGKWGCRVFSANTFEQALKISAQHHLDVWLVDYHLGGKIENQNGLVLIEQYAKGAAAALITAHNDEILIRTAKSLGITIINKPLKPAMLRAFLSTV